MEIDGLTITMLQIACEQIEDSIAQLKDMLPMNSEEAEESLIKEKYADLKWPEQVKAAHILRGLESECEVVSKIVAILSGKIGEGFPKNPTHKEREDSIEHGKSVPRRVEENYKNEFVIRAPERKYYCAYCGFEASSPQQLTNTLCQFHPNGAYKGYNILYQGLEKKEYVCIHCSIKSNTLKGLCQGVCIHNHNSHYLNERGHHEPSIN